MLFYLTIVILTLTCVFFLSRLGVRRWLEREAFRLDDYLMASGLVCMRALVLTDSSDPRGRN